MTSRLSVSVIKEHFKSIDSETDAFFQECLVDERKGVQQAILQWRKQQNKKQEIEKKFQSLLTIEKSYWQRGKQAIAGIDEVGRGPLAGPVVAAAVILPQDCRLLEVNDSKQLSEKKRQILFEQIQSQALSISIGVMDEKVIDEVNIYQATRLAMKQAVENMLIMPDQLLLDAMQIDISIPQESFIKGDARSISIAAASIVAKVTRDDMMKKYHQKYPYYGFDKNAGYGTKEHLKGIKEHGICPIHRRTFAPVKDFV